MASHEPRTHSDEMGIQLECEPSRPAYATLSDNCHAARGAETPRAEYIDVDTACKQLSVVIAPIPIRRVMFVGVESLRLQPQIQMPHQDALRAIY